MKSKVGKFLIAGALVALSAVVVGAGVFANTPAISKAKPWVSTHVVYELQLTTDQGSQTFVREAWFDDQGRFRDEIVKGDSRAVGSFDAWDGQFFYSYDSFAQHLLKKFSPPEKNGRSIPGPLFSTELSKRLQTDVQRQSATVKGKEAIANIPATKIERSTPSGGTETIWLADGDQRIIRLQFTKAGRVVSDARIVMVEPVKQLPENMFSTNRTVSTKTELN